MTHSKNPFDLDQSHTVKQEFFLRGTEVRERTKIGKTKRRELMLKGQFPLPIKVCGGRTNYWLASEIEHFIANQVTEHRTHLEKVVNDPLNAFLYKAVNSSNSVEAPTMRTRVPRKTQASAAITRRALAPQRKILLGRDAVETWLPSKQATNRSKASNAYASDQRDAPTPTR